MQATQGVQVIVNGRLVNACHPIVLCLEESADGLFSDLSVITIPVSVQGGTLPVLDPQAQKQIANEYQGKLLMYRLQNYRKVRESSFDVPELSARFREMARCLGACIAGDPEVEELLTKLLREQDSDVQPGIETELHSAVVEALLRLCHEPEKQALGVAEITAAANKILEKRGELIELKARSVGSHLRSLGFATKRLDAKGRGFTLLNSVRKRIHELAKSHKLMRVSNRSAHCSQCTDMFPEEDVMDDESDLIRRLDTISDEELEAIF
jgi:hypothetical protein